MNELKIISGDFLQGEHIVVSINGEKAKRKVFYSKDIGDLYVRYKGLIYLYCEFN